MRIPDWLVGVGWFALLAGLTVISTLLWVRMGESL